MQSATYMLDSIVCMQMSQSAVQDKTDTPEPDTQQLQPPQEGWEDESRQEAASKAGNVMFVPVLYARSRHITCQRAQAVHRYLTPSYMQAVTLTLSQVVTPSMSDPQASNTLSLQACCAAGFKSPKAEEALPWSRNRAPLPPRDDPPQPEPAAQRRRDREPPRPLPQPGPEQVRRMLVTSQRAIDRSLMPRQHTQHRGLKRKLLPGTAPRP